MKILIVEGIATSGKSSLIKKITELYKDPIRIYSESETHVPIKDVAEELHVEFFKSLLHDATESNADLVVFDRYYLTQAFRAKADIFQYAELEDLLSKQKTFVVYLQVDEDAIAERVKMASENDRIQLGFEHGENKWADYIKTKGQTFEEIAQYYVDQQRSQLELLKQSKLDVRIFNTTQHEYEKIARQILES